MMKKPIDITEELREMAIFLKTKFASRENLLAHGLEQDYDKALIQSGSTKKLTLPERIRIDNDKRKARNISYCEKTFYRHVPMLKHRPKKPKHTELVSQIESEIIELAEQNNLRLQAKLHSDDVSFFKRKLALQTKMIDPTRVPNNLAARQFDADFLDKYQASNLTKNQLKMRKILLGPQPAQSQVTFHPQDVRSPGSSPKPSEKADSKRHIRIKESQKEQVSRFKRLNDDRVYKLDNRAASETKLMGKSMHAPSNFAMFSQGNLPKAQSQERSDFSRLDVRDYAVDKSLGRLYKQSSLRVVKSAVTSGASTPTRGGQHQDQNHWSPEHSLDQHLPTPAKRSSHAEGSDPQQHTWRTIDRQGRTKNLTHLVSKSYSQEKQTQLIKRLEKKHKQQDGKKLTVLGQDASLHSRKQVAATISELERVRLASFHQSRWVNELAYPSRKTDNFGMKDITADISQAVDKVIERRVVGEVLDRAVRYHFYKIEAGKTFLAYSKDPEVNATFGDMHRSLVCVCE